MADSGVGSGVTIWHNAMYQLAIIRCEQICEIRTEVPLSQQPGRIDLVLTRRTSEPWRHGEAEFLRGLWPHLRNVTLVEFKSPTRGFRAFELSRLLRYGMQYHEQNPTLHHDELSLVLLVPCMNEPLRIEIERLRYHMEDLGDGYARLTGQLPYTVYAAFLNEVAEAEDDPYLQLFTTNRNPRDPAALTWLSQWHLGAEKTMPNIEHMEGYEDFVAVIRSSLSVKQRLFGLTPEERLAGLGPEERLAGLGPEELETLRALLARRDQE